MSSPPNWYDDPSGQFEFRYWDGSRWTEHVSTAGRAQIDVSASSSSSAERSETREDRGGAAARSNQKGLDRQLRRAGVPEQSAETASRDEAALMRQSLLIVNQKAKIVEANAEYTIFGRDGRSLGAVKEMGGSRLAKAVGAQRSYRTKRFVVVDEFGRTLMTLTSPPKVMKSTMVVGEASGREIGRIVQRISLGRTRLDLTEGQRTLGCLRSDGSTRGAGRRHRRPLSFSIENASGMQIGRISQTKSLKEMFSNADNYVVEIFDQPSEPLRSLLVAAALAVDTAFRQ